MYVLKDKQIKQIWVVDESAAVLEQCRQEQSDPDFYEVLEADEKDILWCKSKGLI